MYLAMLTLLKLKHEFWNTINVKCWKQRQRGHIEHNDHKPVQAASP
jgi:hypothetical protein